MRISRRGSAFGVLVLMAATAGLVLWDRLHSEQRVDAQQLADDRLFYTCPMHPHVHRDHPGTCPICGMQLVAETQATEEPAAMITRGVFIDPRMVQNLGVRTAVVTRGALERTITATGNVALDERRLVTVEARAAGWIETLHVSSVGETVEAGRVLAELTSPDLEVARQELALAREIGDAKLVSSARKKLDLLGVASTNDRAKGRVSLRAPISGVVTELLAREGAQIAPGGALLKIADLETVWVIIDVPQVLSASLAAGASASVTAFGEEGSFIARVDYVYPLVDVGTRTVRARLVVDNTDRRLKPGMWVNATIAIAPLTNASANASADVLLVPTEAVIRTGTRSVVIVAQDDGTFRPTEVAIGDEHADRTVVLDGLSEGERIVVSGQFLIDSEASLAGALRRLGHEGHAP